MVDYALLSFSFLQGVFAFFAPCAVSLLPGYLSAFVSKKSTEENTWILIYRALLFGLCTILGIIVVYGVATILILLFREFIKSSIVYIGMGLGVFIILVGILMMFDKPLMIKFSSPNLRAKSEYIDSFLFGITYGLAVLGCLFPFFLAVAVSALSSPTLIEASVYLLVYIVGMSLLMLLFYLLAQFARSSLQKYLFRFLPYVNRVGGALVILAGVYIVWYQSALL